MLTGDTAEKQTCREAQSFSCAASAAGLGATLLGSLQNPVNAKPREAAHAAAGRSAEGGAEDRHANYSITFLFPRLKPRLWTLIIYSVSDILQVCSLGLSPLRQRRVHVAN